jgi:transposase-like protein
MVSNKGVKMETPFIAVGHGELDSNPDVGKVYDCPSCGKQHPVEYGERVEKDGTKTPDPMLAFVKCKKKAYLIGINGKMLK